MQKKRERERSETNNQTEIICEGKKNSCVPRPPENRKTKNKFEWTPKSIFNVFFSSCDDNCNLKLSVCTHNETTENAKNGKENEEKRLRVGFWRLKKNYRNLDLLLWGKWVNSKKKKKKNDDDSVCTAIEQLMSYVTE